jgi:hypothetical protein
VGTDFLDAGARHAVRRDLTLQVEADHRRLAGHVDDRLEHVASELAPLDQLDAGDADALVADLGGAG